MPRAPNNEVNDPIGQDGQKRVRARTDHELRVYTDMYRHEQVESMRKGSRHFWPCLSASSG